MVTRGGILENNPKAHSGNGPMSSSGVQVQWTFVVISFMKCVALYHVLQCGHYY